MERLTQHQLDNLSREDLAYRFNILVQQMDGIHAELKELPNYPKGFAALDGSDNSNRFVRIIDKLTRPFAGTAASHHGVQAITIKVYNHGD